MFGGSRTLQSSVSMSRIIELNELVALLLGCGPNLLHLTKLREEIQDLVAGDARVHVEHYKRTLVEIRLSCILFGHTVVNVQCPLPQHEALHAWGLDEACDRRKSHQSQTETVMSQNTICTG